MKMGLSILLIFVVMLTGCKKEDKQLEREKQNEGFVLVEGGTFEMGSNDGESDEEPIHSVTVNSFYIGKYEVTQKEWVDVMSNNPCRFKGDNLPVASVSWDEIQVFLSKLNQKTGKKYRLPTEAEWEYAAKGGNKSKGYEYSGSKNLDEVAWYDNNSGSQTHPVGTKAPNELGIYDMSGNVWEYCSDYYENNYYSISPNNNPKGPSGWAERVLRGGSFYSVINNCRSSDRKSNSLWKLGSGDVGFRLAQD